MKLLIVDCGATTCRYKLIEANEILLEGFQTGFSPISQPFDELVKLDLKSYIPDQIYFYCTALTDIFMGQAQKEWQQRYPDAEVYVGSDLTAAALACCGDGKGYVHIIGTGSAVNFWDGIKMTNPKINLGYIWEDYSSGFDLAKTMIQFWAENKLTKEEENTLESKFGTLQTFVSSIYKGANIKTLLAQASPCLSLLHSETQIKIINQRLSMYFTKNIDIFADTNQHHFVGSLACLMKDQIDLKLKQSGKRPGRIMANTIDELCNYYMRKITKS